MQIYTYILCIYMYIYCIYIYITCDYSIDILLQGYEYIRDIKMDKKLVRDMEIFGNFWLVKFYIIFHLPG